MREQARETIEDDGERITSPMPADETIVEVKLKDGRVTRAWYSCNISEPGDWDFVSAVAGEEPFNGCDSIASEVGAWRYLTTGAPANV